MLRQALEIACCPSPYHTTHGLACLLIHPCSLPQATGIISSDSDKRKFSLQHGSQLLYLRADSE